MNFGGDPIQPPTFLNPQPVGSVSMFLWPHLRLPQRGCGVSDLDVHAAGAPGACRGDSSPPFSLKVVRSQSGRLLSPQVQTHGPCGAALPGPSAVRRFICHLPWSLQRPLWGLGTGRVGSQLLGTRLWCRTSRESRRCARPWVSAAAPSSVMAASAGVGLGPRCPCRPPARPPSRGVPRPGRTSGGVLPGGSVSDTPEVSSLT